MTRSTAGWLLFTIYSYKELGGKEFKGSKPAKKKY